METRSMARSETKYYRDGRRPAFPWRGRKMFDGGDGVLQEGAPLIGGGCGNGLLLTDQFKRNPAHLSSCARILMLWQITDLKSTVPRRPKYPPRLLLTNDRQLSTPCHRAFYLGAVLGSRRCLEYHHLNFNVGTDDRITARAGIATASRRSYWLAKRCCPRYHTLSSQSWQSQGWGRIFSSLLLFYR